jgi:sugar phosphate isomerase/epimerase
MKLTREQFLKMSAGAATMATVPILGTMTASAAAATSFAPASSQGKGPKRGVSLYSYEGEYEVSMTLEDCFADMYDMGAEGLEILASGHIPGYPNPTDEWIENWFALLNKYQIVPVEYGHWVDSRRNEGRELTSKESYDMIVRDIKLANKLGFKIGRTKLGVIDEVLTPVKNWQEFINMALPVAEEYNFKMCPEIHMPTILKSKMVDDYIDFIVRTGTKNFGLNIDFGVFAKRDERMQIPGMSNEISAPEDLIPLLPYVYACHAKFSNMSDELIETTIPYDRILQILKDKNWDGYLLSEYEGKDKAVPGYASDQLRRQHVMMKRCLGEA